LEAAAAVGEEAVVTDAYEPPGQEVEEEAAQELDATEGHDALAAVVTIVLPGERDLLGAHGHEAAVGDRHAVGVAREVAQDVSRATERRLGVDDPIPPMERPQESTERGGLGQRRELSVEGERRSLKM